MPKRATKLNWSAIRARYVTGEDQPSLRALAKEFKCSPTAVASQSRKGEWTKLRAENLKEIDTKLAQSVQNDTVEAQTLYLKAMKSVRNAHLKDISPVIATFDKEGNQTGFKFKHEIKSHEGLVRATVELSKYVDLLEGRATSRVEIIEPDKELLIAFVGRLDVLEADGANGLAAEFRAAFKMSEVVKE